MNDWTTAFREIVEAVPREEFPDLAAECARAQMLMQQRATATPVPKPRALDEWIDATEAGEMIGMSRSWCYEHRDELGGRHRGGAVRYSVRRLKAYLERGQE